MRVVDWGAGAYETTAIELAPAAEAVVAQAGISPGEDVIDIACGTGNAALLAAVRGARVVGVDGAARLLEVARERARDESVVLDLREGDLHALPVDENAADVVVSVFGLIFARDPAQALREVARVLRPGGRAVFSAWVPEGPIDAMLDAMAAVIGRVTAAPAPRRFPWADPVAVASAAAEAHLALDATIRAELPIRAASPEAYIAASQEHPMALAVRPVVQRAGIADEVRDAMTSVLRAANEEPDRFLVQSPYVMHELRMARPVWRDA